MTTTTDANVPAQAGIRREVTKGPILLDKIDKGPFQKSGTLTAQIRQVVTTKSFYPGQKTTSNLQGNVFSAEEFGITSQEFESTETRIAWIPVPEKSTTEEVVAKLLAAHKKGATIYRVLSNEPVLSDDQKYAITQGLRTMDDFANSQVVRYPENEKTIADGTANKITLDPHGNVQYRRTFFWNAPQEDHDVREKSAIYVSPEIAAELKGASVMAGQTIM